LFCFGEVLIYKKRLNAILIGIKSLFATNRQKREEVYIGVPLNCISAETSFKDMFLLFIMRVAWFVMRVAWFVMSVAWLVMSVALACNECSMGGFCHHELFFVLK